jgi:hypothetical protein
LSLRYWLFAIFDRYVDIGREAKTIRKKKAA